MLWRRDHLAVPSASRLSTIVSLGGSSMNTRWLKAIQVWAAQPVVVVEHGRFGAGREGDSHRVRSIGHERDHGLRELRHIA